MFRPCAPIAIRGRGRGSTSLLSRRSEEPAPPIRTTVVAPAPVSPPTHVENDDYHLTLNEDPPPIPLAPSSLPTPIWNPILEYNGKRIDEKDCIDTSPPGRAFALSQAMMLPVDMQHCRARPIRKATLQLTKHFLQAFQQTHDLLDHLTHYVDENTKLLKENQLLLENQNKAIAQALQDKNIANAAQAEVEEGKATTESALASAEQTKKEVADALQQLSEQLEICKALTDEEAQKAYNQCYDSLTIDHSRSVDDAYVDGYEAGYRQGWDRALQATEQPTGSPLFAEEGILWPEGYTPKCLTEEVLAGILQANETQVEAMPKSKVLPSASSEVQPPVTSTESAIVENMPEEQVAEGAGSSKQHKWPFCVMSEASRDLGASAESNIVGPDYFAFYTREVAELLSQDEDFLPFSSETSELARRTHGHFGEKDVTSNGKENTLLGSLFCNGIGARLSDFKKERLKALLHQSVVALSQEVDEMLDPVLAIRRIQSHLRDKKSLSSYSSAACEGDAEEHPHKKIKLSSPSSLISIPRHLKDSSNKGKDADFLEKKKCNGVKKSCACCHVTETPLWMNGPEGPRSLCNACGLKFKKGKETLPTKEQNKEACLVPNIGADNEYGEDLVNKGKDADFLDKEICNGIMKSCAQCQVTKTPQWRNGPEGPRSLCNACGLAFKKGKVPPATKDQNKESCLVPNTGADSEYREVDNDLQFLLENDAMKVEQSIKKHSNELSTTLGYMEQQLEKLLDTVLSNCRQMTLSEKQQLRKLIQKLPPRNLDRVVEIIGSNKPAGKYSSDEIHVDLEKEDNRTLWRLYYYVEAVESSRNTLGS